MAVVEPELLEDILPQELVGGLDAGYKRASEETEEQSGFSYDALRRQNWHDILWRVGLTLILTVLLMLLISPWIQKKFKRGRCYQVATFFLIFFVTLFILGNHFLKNLSVFILGAIVITSILTVFIFLIYDLSHC